MYYTKDADVFVTNDGYRIVYPYDLDTTKQNLTVEQIIQARQRIPDDIHKVMQNEIQVVDYKNPEDAYWRTVYKNFTDSYMVGGEKVTVFANTHHDNDYLVEAITHEGGHYLDRYLEGTIYDPFSSTTKWADATADDLALIGFGSVTSYGANAMVEDFAESLMMLVKDPDMMERQFPNRTKLLKTLISKHNKKN